MIEFVVKQLFSLILMPLTIFTFLLSDIVLFAPIVFTPFLGLDISSLYLFLILIACNIFIVPIAMFMDLVRESAKLHSFLLDSFKQDVLLKRRKKNVKDKTQIFYLKSKHEYVFPNSFGFNLYYLPIFYSNLNNLSNQGIKPNQIFLASEKLTSSLRDEFECYLNIDHGSMEDKFKRMTFVFYFLNFFLVIVLFISCLEPLSNIYFVLIVPLIVVYLRVLTTSPIKFLNEIEITKNTHALAMASQWSITKKENFVKQLKFLFATYTLEALNRIGVENFLNSQINSDSEIFDYKVKKTSFMSIMAIILLPWSFSFFEIVSFKPLIVFLLVLICLYVYILIFPRAKWQSNFDKSIQLIKKMEG